MTDFPGFFRVFMLKKPENHQKRQIFTKKCKKIAKKFGVVKIVRIFAIPKQSGGGEMVDTLL